MWKGEKDVKAYHLMTVSYWDMSAWGRWTLQREESAVGTVLQSLNFLKSEQRQLVEKLLLVITISEVHPKEQAAALQLPKFDILEDWWGLVRGKNRTGGSDTWIFLDSKHFKNLKLKWMEDC